MKMVKSALVLTLLSAAVAVSFPTHAKKNKIGIELREWNVTVSEEFISAGEIEFSVKNKGKEEHELVIIKLNTDAATGRLPVDKDGGINEDTMNFGVMVGEIEGLKPGKRAKESFTLKPGRYAIVCNMIEEEDDGSIEAHYSMGMHAVLNVE